MTAKRAPRHAPHAAGRAAQGRPVDPYWCPRCGEPFPFFDELADHARDVHHVELHATFNRGGR